MANIASSLRFRADAVLGDCRHALRSFRKSPGFTAAALSTLGLGLGLTTAVFTVVYAVLLRPLPFGAPERLVSVWRTDSRTGSAREPVSFLNYQDLRDRSHLFTGLAAVTTFPWNMSLLGDRETEQVRIHFASGNLFETLKVRAALGRLLRPEDDRPEAAPAAVLSFAFWERGFAADKSVLGRVVRLDEMAVTIVGVLPREFVWHNEADFWGPLAFNPLIGRGRAVSFLGLTGRLAEGVSLEKAGAELTSLMVQLVKEHPEANAGVGLSGLFAQPLHRDLTGRVRAGLLVLWGAVAGIWAIVSANLANLLLARSSARRKETAVRAALGASRSRLMAQHLIESVTLATLGGVLGLGTAFWAIQALIAFGPPELAARAQAIGIGGPVFAFAFLLSLATGVVFGVAPALHVSGTVLSEVLKDEGRAGMPTRSSQRFRGVLVATEVALAILLLVASGLLIRSFANVLNVNPGFSTQDVLAAQVALPRASYAQPQDRGAFVTRLFARLSAVPGVVSVGAVTRLPFFSGENNITSELLVEGQAAAGGKRFEIDFRRASPDYFRTMGIPLENGRLFTEAEGASGFVLINGIARERFFAGEDPVGKRIRLGPDSPNARWLTVIGVVGSVKHLGLDTDSRPEVYLHYDSSPASQPILVVRTNRAPSELVPVLRAQLALVDKSVPLAKVEVLRDAVDRSLSPRRFSMLLLTAFGGVALLLAAIGVYGVMSFSTNLRRREIGVRMALGARASDIRRLVVGHGMRLPLLGVLAGLLAAMALTRVLASLLYEVTPRDPLTLVAVVLVVTAAAFAASFIPAERASRVNPTDALREG